MEFLDSVWQIGIMALVAGALIGVLAYRLLSPSVKDADKIRTELDDAKKELNSYKASVNQHFGKTAELVNDLTQNYVKVYQHLAEGAQTLGDSKTFNNLLEQHQGRVSIAVDEETGAADQADHDLVAEQAVTQERPEKTVDEHAEPFTETTDSTASDPDTPKSGNSGSKGKPDAAAEAGEPVVNIDALDQATGKPDAENRADAKVTTPDGEAKTEVRTTTH